MTVHCHSSAKVSWVLFFFDINTNWDLQTGKPAPQESIVTTCWASFPLLSTLFIPFSSSRQNPFGLTIALDASGSATGELYWDDGELEHVMSETYLADITFSTVRSFVLYVCPVFTILYTWCQWFSHQVRPLLKKLSCDIKIEILLNQMFNWLSNFLIVLYSSSVLD